MLAANGIRFTVLSPYQAQRVRSIGGRAWRGADGGRIDPSRAYEARLPGNKSIALFFYDGPISRAVAFERLLDNGVGFANRLFSGLSDSRDWPQLAHIATDGESYGHHHRRGEMALAYAPHHVESIGHAQLTIYGEFLEKHPPTHQVEIIDRTAWSCVHGVGGWERDCGCNTGGRPDWNQGWRGPLRQALDWLRDEVSARFERTGGELFEDPWAARNAYIDVILDRSAENIDAFLGRQARGALPLDARTRAMRLLEMQRHAQLMYTSCAWFFDEISGLETTQVLKYAARVTQLAREVFDDDLEAGLLERLASAPSNIPENGDGGRVYERFARPAAVDLMKVAFHYACSSLFEEYGEEVVIYGYALRSEARDLHVSGPMRLLVGRVHVASRVTGATTVVSYAVMHQGDHNLTGGVREYQGEAAYGALHDQTVSLFQAADIPAMIRFLDEQFSAATYSLRSLFHEQQRRVLRIVLDERLRQAAATHQQLVESQIPLLRVLGGLGIPLPRAFLASVDFVLNSGLRELFEADWPDLARAQRLLDEARSWTGVELDVEPLRFALGGTLERLLAGVLEAPRDTATIERLTQLVAFARRSELHVDLSRAQNLYDRARRRERVKVASHGADVDARRWIEQFDALGRELTFRVPQ